MALRTFRYNPSLGGFGGESALSSSDVTDNVGADAFCQIIKELVDNAVDACRVTGNNNKRGITNLAGTKKKTNRKTGLKNVTPTIYHHTTTAATSVAVMHRVRINLDPSTEENGTELLRVTVTDNGCGMKDIQTCVDAFRTTKGHNADIHNDKERHQHDKNTSGRYGIGLTRAYAVYMNCLSP